MADAAFWGFQTASDFAGRVEELSRTVEYLQLVAAAAVDRTRRQATAAASRGTGTGWTTGWRDTSSGSEAGTPGASVFAAGTVEEALAASVDDGYRNTTEFLRARLRIGAAEARRRLALAEDLPPRTARLDEAT